MRTRTGISVIMVAAASALVVLAGSVASAQSSSQPKYVALGSSFASGPRIPETVDEGCGRSNQNYANLVASMGLWMIFARKERCGSMASSIFR